MTIFYAELVTISILIIISIQHTIIKRHLMCSTRKQLQYLLLPNSNSLWLYIIRKINLLFFLIYCFSFFFSAFWKENLNEKLIEVKERKIPQGEVAIWDLKENVRDEYGFCLERSFHLLLITFKKGESWRDFRYSLTSCYGWSLAQNRYLTLKE